MTPQRAPVVLVLLLIAGAAAAQPARKPYTSEALGFTATFPLEVKERLDGEGGGTAAGVDPAGVMYMVGVTPARPELSKSKSVKEQLDDGLAGALAKVKGKLTAQKDIKVGKHPGREVEIELQGGHATFRAILVGPRTVLIGVVQMAGTTLPMTPAAFFASFKLNRE
jgi:hypothetical protein